MRVGIRFKGLNAAFAGLVTGILAVLTATGPVAAADFLAPEKAFSATAIYKDATTVQLAWKIADGYYLYRERIKLHTASSAKNPVELATPPAQTKFDSNFNRTMEIYHSELALPIDVAHIGRATTFVVEYQGCAEAGLCYPPQYAKVELAAFRAGNSAAPGASGIGQRLKLELVDQPDTEVVATAAPAAASGAAAPTDLIGRTLADGNLLKTAAVFWLAGLLLAFTPCVLPMVPILSTLIAGQSGVVTRKRGFVLSLSYVLGMALVYAGLGMAAGLAGEGLAAALQNPWVLSGFAALLATLSLSMFGVFELQMPAFIQNRAVGWSNGFKGGSNTAVFVMGGVSALIIGPCVAAPLAGALVFISQTRNVVTGGVALFSMALGMGVPLLLVGMSAGSLLPRAGGWMEMVKHIFGLVLLATAIWIVSPVVPVQLQMLLWAALLLGAAYTLGGIFPAKQPGLMRLTGVATAAVAALLLVGAASGGRSLLQPLAHLQPSAAGPASGGTLTKTPAEGLPFKRVASVSELELALSQANQNKQTTMLDFYADWCVACKEYESFTFSDPAVRDRIGKGQVQLLQVDVTDNSAHDKALLKRFALFGPPAIVFMKGNQPTDILHQVVGYQNTKDFSASLDRANIR